MYRPAMLRHWHGLSPLDFWEGDEYKPLTISGSCDRLRVVDVGMFN